MLAARVSPSSVISVTLQSGSARNSARTAATVAVSGRPARRASRSSGVMAALVSPLLVWAGNGATADLVADEGVGLDGGAERLRNEGERLIHRRIVLVKRVQAASQVVEALAP